MTGSLEGDAVGNRLKKGLVIGLILVGIAGIFLVKNQERNTALTKGTDGAQVAGDIDPKWLTEAFDLDATTNLDIEALKAHGLPIIVDFGADSCEPCKKMAPVLVDLNQSLRGRAIVKFADVWKNGDIVQGYPVRAIPTQFFFDAEGKPYVPTDEEEAMQNGFMMYVHKDTGEHLLTAHEGGLTEEQLLAVLEEMEADD